MVKVNYAYEDKEEVGTARAMGKSLKISPKHSVEICREIRGMNVEKAKNYLNEVIEMVRAVPFKRHNKKVGHRKGLEKWPSGRYPVKAAAQILQVIENAEANAEYVGLDTENLKIEHISSHRGFVYRGAIPRAFGRATPFNTPTTHIQVVLAEDLSNLDDDDTVAIKKDNKFNKSNNVIVDSVNDVEDSDVEDSDVEDDEAVDVVDEVDDSEAIVDDVEESKEIEVADEVVEESEESDVDVEDESVEEVQK
jgi:large subunit ribosomal protein L22